MLDFDYDNKRMRLIDTRTNEVLDTLSREALNITESLDEAEQVKEAYAHIIVQSKIVNSEDR